MAACGGGGATYPTSHGGGGGITSVSTSAPPGTSSSTGANVIFTYETTGQSSSPNFTVATAGTYTVTYQVTGTSDQPNCAVTIALVSDQGDSRRILGTPVTLQPGQTTQGSSPQQLGAGGWRFQEGGGCDWKVTVTRGG